MPLPTDADQYVNLKDGKCHYRFDGPERGWPILLIHGGTVAAWEFDRLVIHLHHAGYRTLRPDLFGHGYSDRPHTRYEPALFARQMLDLLDALDIGNRIPVLGHSLGAAVAARIAGSRPERFSCVILGAPLVDYTEAQPVTQLLRWPLLGEIMMQLLVLPLLTRRRARNYRDIDGGYLVAKFNSQLKMPGFGRALLAMFRDGALIDQLDAYRAFAVSRLPVFVLRGENDAIVLPRQVHSVLALLSWANYLEIGGAGHSFLLRQPAQLAPLIVDWIESHGVDDKSQRSC